MLNVLLALAILVGGFVSGSSKTGKVNYIPPAPQVQSQIEGQEILSQRTKNTKTYQVGPNQYTLRASVGALHYRDGGGAWQDIDNNWNPAVAPWNWEMTQDSYTTKALSDFTAGQVIEYSSQGEYVRFQPMALQWTNNLSQIQQISMPQNVAVTVSGGRISWANAYGTGRNFAWINRPERLVTLLTLVGLLPAPSQTIINGGNPVAELNFIFDPSSALEIYVNGVLWNKRDTINTGLQIAFRRGGETLFSFASPLASDSAAPEVVVSSQLRRTGNNLYISVRVPYSWLQTATYPVQIDPTFSVAASADDVWVYDTGNFSSTSTAFDLGDPSNQRVAARFLNMNIPQSSTINSAKLTITARSTDSSATCNFKVFVENVDNATQITSAADYDGRSLTTGVNWNAVPAWTAGVAYDTPDITADVQTVVNRALWASNNSMNTFVKNNGSSTNANRRGASWDNVTYTEPILTVTWTEGGGATKHYGFIF